MVQESVLKSEPQKQEEKILDRRESTCCIVGGGPAGAMLALLLVRQGIEVTLLEAHADFDRQFRGDSLYPSVLEAIDEIGLAQHLHELPHTKMSQIPIETPVGSIIPIDMRTLRSRYSYIMMIPQVEFLKFIAEEASRYAHFHLVMSASVRELIEEGGQILGVRYRTSEGWHEVQATVTIGADGRFSKVRSLAHLQMKAKPTGIDAIWFRLPVQEGDPENSFGRIDESGTMVAMLRRTDHWQIAHNIPKGTYSEMRAKGLPEFRRTIAAVVPILEERMEQIQDWRQLSVLDVETSRLQRWYRPGLLLIGDAAHVMSPALGVGVNFAIQDAIVAANILTKPLQNWQKTRIYRRPVPERHLAEVQWRRELPVRLIQSIQESDGAKGEKQILQKLFSQPEVQRKLINVLQRFITRMAALGPWRIHVRYKQAQA